MVSKILKALVGGLARGVALLALLALLLPALLVLYTTTDDFRTRLLARLAPELDGRMAGDLSIGGLSGSPFSNFRFVEVALAWHDEEIARAASIAIEVDWSALLFGRVEIARIDVEAPEVLLREHAVLGWDWREALAPLIPAPDPDRPNSDASRPIVVERLAISDAAITVAAQARAPIRIDGLAAHGRLDFEQRRLRIEAASLALGQSKLTAAGEAPFADRFVFDVTIESLHPGDLARFDPALAESLAFLSPVTGQFVLGGDPDAFDATGQLVWPETKLTFDLHGDPRALGLARSSIAARLESADLARFAPAAGIAGPLDLQLELANGEGTFGARLRSGSRGELSAEGLVSLVGTPETKLQFAAKQFDLARAFPAQPEWSGALSGRGTLDLKGRDRRDLGGSLTLSLRRGSVHSSSGAARSARRSRAKPSSSASSTSTGRSVASTRPAACRRSLAGRRSSARALRSTISVRSSPSPVGTAAVSWADPSRSTASWSARASRPISSSAISGSAHSKRQRRSSRSSPAAASRTACSTRRSRRPGSRRPWPAGRSTTRRA